MLIDVAAQARHEGWEQTQRRPLRQFELLLQVADAARAHHGPLGRFQSAGQHGQQRGLAGAIGAGDEDLVARSTLQNL